MSAPRTSRTGRIAITDQNQPPLSDAELERRRLAQETVTNDAVAGETTDGSVPYRELTPESAENDLAGEPIDLDDEPEDESTER